MQSNHPRAVNAVSLSELERRWSLTRNRMRELGIDALVLQNSSDWVGGYLRWLTTHPATNRNPTSRVFPLEEGMSRIEQGPFGGLKQSGGEELRVTGIARR